MLQREWGGEGIRLEQRGMSVGEGEEEVEEEEEEVEVGEGQGQGQGGGNPTRRAPQEEAHWRVRERGGGCMGGHRASVAVKAGRSKRGDDGEEERGGEGMRGEWGKRG